MELKSVFSSNISQNKPKAVANVQHMSQPNLYNLKMQQALKVDAICFTGKSKNTSPGERMRNFAIDYLNEIGLKENQPLNITADSKYVPFLKILTEEAYKKGSGNVSFKVVEPEIEALKKKYNITEDFDYKKEAQQELEDAGALFIKFNDANCPYKAANLSKKETKAQVESLHPNIPKKVLDIFKPDPEEIFKTAMDVHEGEPVLIRGEREHLPQIIRFADWLYSKNKTKLIDIKIIEPKEFNTNIAFYKYANEDLIGKHPNSSISAYKEYSEKDVAWLVLKGSDPELYSEVDSKKMAKDSAPLNQAAKEYNDKITVSSPWLVYYAPTTRSITKAYPEYGDDKVSALKHALKDAKELTRAGKLKEVIDLLAARSDRMNDLVEQGYKTIHYVSVDPKTKLPDGKTDLKVGLSEKSYFNKARKTMLNGHNSVVNIPTEEVFTSPTANSAQGKVSATLPLVLNGKIIEGIEMTFKDGKVVKVNATKNLDALKEHIKSNKNADRLGEVALVAGSPIAKKNRIFYDTLLDENAACHIALGNCYAYAIKGAKEIKDYQEQQKYLADLNINSSTTHNDFMIGGPNVYVFAENPETGEQVQIIKDDKFILK